MISPDLLLTIRNNPEILVDIPNDQTLYKLCSANTEMRALCEHVDLWEQRFRKYYPAFLDVKLKSNLSWRDAYQITSLIRHYQYLYTIVVFADGSSPEELRNIPELDEFSGIEYDIDFILTPDGRINMSTNLAPLKRYIGEVLATLPLDLEYYKKFLLGNIFDTTDIGFDLVDIARIWDGCIKKASALGKTQLVNTLINFMTELFIEVAAD